MDPADRNHTHKHLNTIAPMDTTAETLREKIEDALLNHRIAPAPELLDSLESLADEAAFPAAADMVAAMIGRLDIRQRVVWERLMGTGPTLDECAAKLGVSRVAVHRQETRLRRRLNKKGLRRRQG
jgi:DNA-directed RNA polymerase specialized sigma24 family protein